MHEQLDELADHLRRQVVDAEVAGVLEDVHRRRLAGAAKPVMTTSSRRGLAHRGAWRSSSSRRSRWMQGRRARGRGLARQAGDRLELLARGGEDRVGRAEVVEQRALARRADARQVVEDRGRHRLVAAHAVVGDREAVGLVADALQQLQRRRVVAPGRSACATPGRKTSSMRLASEITATPRVAEALQRRDAGGELARAAVDDDQVRQRGEGLVALRVVRARSCWRSHCASRRVSTSSIAAKSSGTPLGVRGS